MYYLGECLCVATLAGDGNVETEVNPTGRGRRFEACRGGESADGARAAGRGQR